MYSRSIICSFFLFLFFGILIGNAQNSGSNSFRDTTHQLSPSFLPVYIAKTGQHNFYPLKFDLIDTHMVEVNHFSPLIRSENIYQTLGSLEQAHQTMLFQYERSMGFQRITFPYPLIFKTQDNLNIYELSTVYTKIGYFYGLPSEHMLDLNFAKKIRRGVFSLDLYAATNEGYFVHQATQGLSGDMQYRYATRDGRYGLRASYILNRVKNQENGGLQSVQQFIDHKLSDNKGYAVNIPNGLTHIQTHDINFQHYVSLYPKKSAYAGYITHNAHFQKINSSYFDYLDSTLQFQIYTFESDTTRDTLSCYKIVNSIQWSNYSPVQLVSDANSYVHVAAGIMHEFFEDQRVRSHFHSFTPFMRGNLKLFNFMDVFGTFSYSFGGYTDNDAIAKIRAEWLFRKDINLKVGGHANFYRVSPDYNFSHFSSNHFAWDWEWGKQNIADLGVGLTYKNYRMQGNLYLLDHFVLFGPEYTPIQVQEFTRVVQLNIYAPIRYKNFGSTFNLMLQSSSSDSIQVPLFAGKTSVYYIVSIFKKKLKLQLGADLMYNSTYYAPAYLPALYSFYHQYDERIGNYWFLDVYATVRISRIYFFARVGNLLSPVQKYRMFTTPYYPTVDHLFTVGINWRFHD